ncbi:DUF1697 domain-containing protein [Lutibacter holmesii]|uniref:DUF1697 domain-containing protein n=1 Tax=Lutibacter holmesii TaxID=1137985 RepID=A0ABW3WSB4_9FLAO
MVTFIALLRGINVSGHNKIKMANLKQLFLNNGFSEVETYIQSGNVIFKSKELNTLKIEQRIITSIEKQFGFTIKVLVLTKTELSTVFSSNPFLDREFIDISKLCVTFLSATPTLETISEIKELGLKNNDEFYLNNNTVYLHCPNGFGKTKLTNNLFERKFKVNATTRNWKTITKLIELSN